MTTTHDTFTASPQPRASLSARRRRSSSLAIEAAQLPAGCPRSAGPFFTGKDGQTYSVLPPLKSQDEIDAFEHLMMARIIVIAMTAFSATAGVGILFNSLF